MKNMFIPLAVCLLSTTLAQQPEAAKKPHPTTLSEAEQKKSLKVFKDIPHLKKFPRQYTKLVTPRTIHSISQPRYTEKHNAAERKNMISYCRVYVCDDFSIVYALNPLYPNKKPERYEIFPRSLKASNIITPRPAVFKPKEDYFPISKKEAQQLESEGALERMRALAHGLNTRLDGTLTYTQGTFRANKGLGKVGDIPTCYPRLETDFAKYANPATRESMPRSKQIDALLGIYCNSMTQIPKHFKKARIYAFLPQRMQLYVDDESVAKKVKPYVLQNFRFTHDDEATSCIPELFMRNFIADYTEVLSQNSGHLLANLTAYHTWLGKQGGAQSSEEYKLLTRWLSAMRKYEAAMKKSGVIRKTVIARKIRKVNPGEKLFHFGKEFDLKYEP